VWVRRQKELYLQPSYLGKVQKGVGDAMDACLGKFEPDLGGIILEHKNAALLGVDGSIRDEDTVIRLKVEADFKIFRPYEGCHLEGVVNQVSANHLSCLVFSKFNVSCPRSIGREGDWLGMEACIGQTITCTVNKIDLMSRLPYIRADIVELHPWEGKLENGEGEVTEVTEIRKRLEVELVSDCESEGRKSESLAEAEEEESEVESVKRVKVEKDSGSESERKKKKKKKSRDVEEKPDLVQEEEVVEEISTKKKRKSKIKNEELEVVSSDSSSKHSLKRKRKSESAEESPQKVKKKKRKTLVGSDGEEFYYDKDGCPVKV